MFNFIASWRREREAVRELSRLTNLELADLGIARSDICDIAEDHGRSAPPAVVRRNAGSLAPAWGAHLRRSAAA